MFKFYREHLAYDIEDSKRNLDPTKGIGLNKSLSFPGTYPEFLAAEQARLALAKRELERIRPYLK